MIPSKRARAVMVLRGKELAKAFMARHKLGEKDFFESQFPEHVEKRKALIGILHSNGFNQPEMCRIMRRSSSTIRYWVDPQERARELERRRRNWELGA